MILIGILGCLCLGCLFVVAALDGQRQVEKAHQLELVVPLTRKSAEQLPAEESLVRASSEPPDVQEEVLLRAAGSEPYTPPEELLRASRPE